MSVCKGQLKNVFLSAKCTRKTIALQHLRQFKLFFPLTGSRDGFPVYCDMAGGGL